METGMQNDVPRFEGYQQKGQFGIPDYFDHPKKNAIYAPSNGSLVELQSSHDIWDFIRLDATTALGWDISWKCYDPAFAMHRTPDHTSPLRVWDLQTGRLNVTLDGFHHGEVRGAQLVNNRELITWARDFLIRRWNLETGRLLETIPLPTELDDSGIPIVNSRLFGQWSPRRREQYVSTRAEVSFRVTLMTQSDSEDVVTVSGPFENTSSSNQPINRLTVPEGRLTRPRPKQFQELENIEAGYSDAFGMQNGGLLIGGTSYGANDHVYVWDGGLNLVILISSLSFCGDFEIDGEVSPGVVGVRSFTSTMRFSLENTNG